MNSLIARPLLAQSFARFGTVTELPTLGSATDIPAAFEAAADASAPVVRVVQVSAAVTPLTIAVLENHPFSAQTFLTLNAAPSLVVVCASKADGRPDPATIQAFIARPDQIVTYGRGVWHHKVTPLLQPGAYAMVMQQTGRVDDTTLFDLPTPYLCDANI